MASNLELKRAVALALGYEEIKQANGRLSVRHDSLSTDELRRSYDDPFDIYCSLSIPDWPYDLNLAFTLLTSVAAVKLERGQFAWVCVIDGQEALDDEPARAVCLAWLASKGVVVQ